jgi:hypothetical protein
MSKQDLDNSDVDIITQDIDTIDLGGYGAAGTTYTISGYGTDTITLDSSMMYTGSITAPSVTTINSINSGHYTIGSAGTSGQFYTSTGTSGNWNNPPTVNISNTGIDMKSGTDIKIDGKSLKQFMDKMEERLAILVPDPAKLEKFEALKKAYEHYKLMESLCQELPKEEE